MRTLAVGHDFLAGTDGPVLVALGIPGGRCRDGRFLRGPGFFLWVVVRLPSAPARQVLAVEERGKAVGRPRALIAPDLKVGPTEIGVGPTFRSGKHHSRDE